MATTLPDDLIEQLAEKGITREKLAEYREVLLKGYPFIKLAENCRLGSEIHSVSDIDKRDFIARYRAREDCKVLKFVPASGAASRMFKDLFAALEGNENSESADAFFNSLEDFPFGESLLSIVGLPRDFPLNDKSTRIDILKALLLEDGLNYGRLPKGMIKFHKYRDSDSRTAFEEHFHEAKMYAVTGNEAHLHFTIPENTQEEAKVHLAELRDELSKALGINFRVETSLQKPATDTPAIYEDSKEWVIDENDNLLLRPAGHGALLENLNELDADLVFIKNIDNVVPDHLKGTTVEYKELLAGILLDVQESVFGFSEALEKGNLDHSACTAFFQKWFAADVDGLGVEDLRDLLNRPLRVCGMVKNQGEPGGGPFLVREPDGSSSLQIVEKAQVDTDDPEQKAILESAGHFNPVDLVVSLKDHRGEPFDLMKYRNPDTGMVVSKNYQGRDIRALELPGLWNGSMHRWNTVFVEVPIDTFNPVKTVFDLLRPGHSGTDTKSRR
ncbi:MAG: DUF4301 family protein [Cryomorphaceae bacterium]